MVKIVDFKSTKQYFKKEFSDTKNNTVRTIRPEEEKFQILIASMLVKEYPLIRITHSSKVNNVCQKENRVCSHESYIVRKIKDISIWENLMIITWESYME